MWHHMKHIWCAHNMSIMAQLFNCLFNSWCNKETYLSCDIIVLLVRRNPSWQMDSPHKGSEVWKALPCYNSIMSLDFCRAYSVVAHAPVTGDINCSCLSLMMLITDTSSYHTSHCLWRRYGDKTAIMCDENYLIFHVLTLLFFVLIVAQWGHLASRILINIGSGN